MSSGDPKLVLTKVTDINGNLYRGDGHCHVKESELTDYIPRDGYHSTLIIKAEEVDYHRRGTTSRTLGNVKVLKVLSTKKNKEKPDSKQAIAKQQYKNEMDRLNRINNLFDIISKGK